MTILDEDPGNSEIEKPSKAGKIAFVRRGNHPLFDLCLKAQSEGAIGVIIVDRINYCKHYDQRCLPGANKAAREGFAAQDVPAVW